MHHQQFVADLLEILGEGFPGLGEHWFLSLTFFIVIHIMEELSHLIEFILPDTSYYYCIQAMVGMTIP